MLAPPTEAARPTQNVEGQVLEMVQPVDAIEINDVWYLGLIIVAFFLAGVMYQPTICPEFQASHAIEGTMGSSERLSPT